MTSSLTEVVILPKTEGKGRSFKALKVSAIMADALWELGGDSKVKHDRPIYAVFAASEGEIRPFVANLLCGRPAIPSNNAYRRRGTGSGYEFMKSAGFKVIYQRHEEGVLATLYLPELLALDNGMVDPKGIKFVVVPGMAYLDVEAKRMDVESIVDYASALPIVKEINKPEKDWQGHVYSGWKEPLSREVLEGMVPLSYLFTLHLSNRSRAPIPPDGKFYMQILLACLKNGLASWSSDDNHGRSEKFGHNHVYKFVEEGVEEGKLMPGIAFMAKHEEIEQLLAKECESYFMRVEGK